MGKVRVTISYQSGRVVHSRYGITQRVETAVRFTDEDGLDDVVDQFRRNHEIIEVLVQRM